MSTRWRFMTPVGEENPRASSTRFFGGGHTTPTRSRRRSPSIGRLVISPARAPISSVSRRWYQRMRPPIARESARAIVNEKPVAWPDEVLRMRPAHLGIVAGKINRTGMLQIVVETFVGQPGVEEASPHFNCRNIRLDGRGV